MKRGIALLLAGVMSLECFAFNVDAKQMDQSYLRSTLYTQYVSQSAALDFDGAERTISVFVKDAVSSDDYAYSLLDAEGNVIREGSVKAVDYDDNTKKVSVKIDTADGDIEKIVLTDAEERVIEEYVDASLSASDIQVSQSETVEVQWNGSAQGYTVSAFRKGEDRPFIERRVSGTSCTLEAEEGEITLSVVPYKEADGHTYYGCAAEKDYTVTVLETETEEETVEEPSENEVAAVADPAEMTLTAEAGTLSMKLTWEAVENAVSYAVVYKTAEAGAETELAKTTDTYTASHKDLKEGSIYWYSVKAFDAEGSVIGASEWVKTTAVVLPAAPGSLKVVNEECKFTITWGKVSGAAGYEVFRYDAAAGTYTSKLDTKDTTYVVKGVEGNKDYSYVVRAYKKAADGTKIYSQNSKVITARPTMKVPAVPKNVKAAPSEHKVQITWSAAADATGYYIYLYNADKGEYESVGSTTELSYTIKGLDASKEQKVQIKAYRKKNGYTAKSAATKAVTFTVTTVVPGQVKGLKATNGDCRVTLQWTAVKNATGYEVFRKNEETGEWDSIGKTKETTFVNAGIEGKKTYQYTVKAYRTANNYTENGKLSSAVSGTPTMYIPAVPVNLKAKAGDHSVILTWDKADKATGYSIYAYDAETDETTYIGASRTLTYTVTGLPKGETATFVITAYRNVDGWKTRSDFSKSASAVPFETIPAKVAKVNVKNGDEEVTLSWDAAKDATGYKVFMVDTATGDRKHLGSTKQLSYKVSNLENGKTYTFCVQSYRRSEPFIAYGEYSANVNGKPVIAPPKKPSSLSVTNSKSGNELKWTAVTKADGYTVYKYDYSKDKYVAIADTTKTTYLDSTAKTTGKYKYMVKAYRKDATGKYESTEGVTKLLFGKDDMATINSAVHPIYYTAYINQSTRLYDTFTTDEKCGTISSGTRVTVLYRRTKRCKIKLSSGKICYVKSSALNYSSQHYTNKDYSTAQKELYVNANGFSSKTEYLAWISTYTQHVYIFKGKKNNWELVRTMPCCSGKISHPTPLGVHEVWSKQKFYQYTSYSYYEYLVRFKYANSFHNRVRYNNGTILDGRMGMPISPGCIRLKDGDAKYVFNTLQKGATVVVY